MAISSILPVQNSVVAPGDSFSFTIDDSYTALVIKVAQSGGDEYAYDYALGGVQTGYTVAITDNGSTHTLEVSRDSGWNKEPTTVSVTENETGSSVTTSFSYYLTATAVYPEGMQPYSDQYDGTLIVTEEDVTVRNDVGWIDYDGTDFVVTDLGSGKVKVELDPAISGSDDDAIHDNVANEISALASKGTPVDADLVIIEDSAAGYVKKKVLFSNLPAGGGGGDGAGQAVYLGTYNMWAQTTQLNPEADGQLVYDDALFSDLDVALTDANAVDFSTMLLDYGGQTIVLVDPSGDKSYWTVQLQNDHFFWDYQDNTTPYVILKVKRLYDEAGFTYADSGSTQYEVWSMGIGQPVLGGRPFPKAAYAADSAEDYSTDIGYPFDGACVIYDDILNKWRFERAIAESSVDPTTDDDSTQGHFDGKLWVNVHAQNLWVCTDAFTGEWTEIIKNQVQYSVGAWDYDEAYGIPNANGEATPNAATGLATTSVQFYQNDDDGVNQKAVLLSLGPGTVFEHYISEGWSETWTVTGNPVDNSTYVTIPVETAVWNPTFPTSGGEYQRITSPGGFVKTDGTEPQQAGLFLGQTSEVNAPASALGELWIQQATGAGDQTLKFTDENGTRFALVPHVNTDAPAAGDDVDDGHEVGQVWVNTTLGDAYICTDNSAAAAVWKIIAT